MEACRIAKKRPKKKKNRKHCVLLLLVDFKMGKVETIYFPVNWAYNYQKYASSIYDTMNQAKNAFAICFSFDFKID